MVCNPLRAFIVLVLLFLHTTIPAAESFRIATYNVENHLEQASGSRPAKSEQAKNKVRERILLITCKVLFEPKNWNTGQISHDKHLDYLRT